MPLHPSACHWHHSYGHCGRRTRLCRYRQRARDGLQKSALWRPDL